MPRSNRYILPGCAYHVTHRCHDRSSLLRFGLDRTEYVKRLRLALEIYPVHLLCYCITSNHIHLLLTAETPDGVSSLMQRLEGELPSTTTGASVATGLSGVIVSTARWWTR